MAKKNTNSATHILDAIKTVNGGVEPTLRAFALVLNIPATRLYAQAKRPVPGQVWDPTVINWDNINDYLTMKLSAVDCDVPDMEALVAAAAEKDKWLAENQVSRIATGANLIDVDGSKMPKRKTAMFEMGGDQESLLAFKHDPAVYKMVYQTAGYTVIRAVNEDGSWAKEEVRVISNSTLNTKCVAPMMLTAGIQERFSGEYAAKLEQAADSESESEECADCAVDLPDVEG